MSTLNPLAQLRADLRDKLTAADFRTFSIVPEKVTPPFAYVAPDEPYIDFAGETGLNFGEAQVYHRIGLVVAAGVNEVKADDLDAFVLRLLQLDLSPHVVQSIDEPGPVRINGQAHLAAIAHVTTQLNLEEIA